ncbi:MAG TPA: hypothetical protein VHE37_07945 [Nevskiaceae bacterium]|nr:hypothetical protein [Nevskiaceae bacterium]
MKKSKGTLAKLALAAAAMVSMMAPVSGAQAGQGAAPWTTNELVFVPACKFTEGSAAVDADCAANLSALMTAAAEQGAKIAVITASNDWLSAKSLEDDQARLKDLRAATMAHLLRDKNLKLNVVVFGTRAVSGQTGYVAFMKDRYEAPLGKLATFPVYQPTAPIPQLPLYVSAPAAATTSVAKQDASETVPVEIANQSKDRSIDVAGH